MSTSLLDAELDAETLLAMEADRLPDVLPDMPDWLLDAPLSTEEPTCGCCGLPARWRGDARRF